jgi:predicted deacylase
VRGFHFGSSALAVDRIEVGELARGEKHRLALALVQNGLGEAVRVPVMVARGVRDGPVFGLTAAVHGNELNGIRIIQRIFRELDPERLSGTVIGVPVVNIPGYHGNRREILEGIDLNRIMPGKPTGNAAEAYAWEVRERVLRPLDFLIDLHTASFGRENSLYVRADLDDAVTRKMALLQAPEIVVHNTPADGTVRGTAEELGVPAITVEVGDPQRFQRRMIDEATLGVWRTLAHYDLLEDFAPTSPAREPIICRRSAWIYATGGGLLHVHSEVGQRISSHEVIAHTRNLFGDVVSEYFAPDDGVVIGRSVNPVCFTGARVIHFGMGIEP